MFKVNNRNTICSKLTIKTPIALIVNFEYTSHLALVFLLLTFKCLLGCLNFFLFSFASQTQIIYHQDAKDPPSVNASVEDIGEEVLYQFLVSTPYS